MKLSKRGRNISKAELQAVTPQGVWLLVQEKEYFLPFVDFPWFEKAAVGDIAKVRLLHKNHLYWPTLDIDLAIESLENLEQYPLLSSAGSSTKGLRHAA